MTGFLAELLRDPKTLAVILTSFGGAIGWLIKKDRDCQRREAVMERDLSFMRERLSKAEGSVETLCNLLKRETHIG